MEVKKRMKRVSKNNLPRKSLNQRAERESEEKRGRANSSRILNKSNLVSCVGFTNRRGVENGYQLLSPFHVDPLYHLQKFYPLPAKPTESR